MATREQGRDSIGGATHGARQGIQEAVARKDVPKDAPEKLVVDQRAKWDMMIKLIDVKLQDLAEIYRLLGSGTGDQADAARRTSAFELVSRYITSAVRERERATD